MNHNFYIQMAKISPWRFWLIGAAAAALALAMLVVAAGLFLILAPVVLASALFYRLRRGDRRETGEAGVIETSYEVVDEPPPGPPRGRLNPRR
ncbi:MAG: hypothetical protein NW215_06330 [Hyphomicrobiales bacterium]|nr:hypothetical protein [Hyphomicrobiales bacterium]